MVFESSSAYISFYTGDCTIFVLLRRTRKYITKRDSRNWKRASLKPQYLLVHWHPCGAKEEADVILLSVLDSHLPMLQLLLQVTCQWQGCICFLERRVRPFSVFLQTSSNLEAELNFSAGPSHSVASLDKKSSAVFSLFPGAYVTGSYKFLPLFTPLFLIHDIFFPF